MAAKSPPAAGVAVVGTVAAGMAPVDAGCEVPDAAGAPKSDGAGLTAAALVEDCKFPNVPPAVDDAARVADVVGVEAAGLLPLNNPPKAPGVVPAAAGAVGLFAANSPPGVDVAELAGAFAANKFDPPPGALLLACPRPKSPDARVVVACDAAGAADLDESTGGAPAGVVDASKNMGFAGVAATVASWLAGVLSVLFPKSERPALGNRPTAGASDVVGA